MCGGQMKPTTDNVCADDIAPITKIYRDAVINGKASFELEPPDEKEMRRRYEDLAGNGYPYLVARIGDEVAGFAYVAPFHSRPAYRWAIENSVYVDPSFQGVGIGTLLLDRLIDICTQKDFRQMIAVIGDSANTGSIRLHEKAGFTHVGSLRAVGWKHGMWLDTVMMQLELGPGRSSPPIPIPEDK
jgi:phosphinothricin acetyltransferase